MRKMRETSGYWDVCWRCDGEGKHVNEALDGFSTSEEIWQDDEFRENYFDGVYDVTCTVCKGRTTVWVDEEEEDDD
jgi:RecJ-like exonuclease